MLERAGPCGAVFGVAPGSLVVLNVDPRTLVKGQVLGGGYTLGRQVTAPALDRINPLLNQGPEFLGETTCRGEADVRIGAKAHVSRASGEREAKDPAARTGACDPEIEIASVSVVTGLLDLGDLDR